MINFFNKKILFLGIAAVLAAILVLSLISSPENNLKVSFLDVGQGDAILIQAPEGQNILIDGGPDNKIVQELDETLPWQDKTIDLMVLSHPHDDHVTGLIEVLKHYEIKQVLYTGAIHNSPNFLTWLEIVKEKEIPILPAQAGQEFSLSKNCKLQVLYPLDNLWSQEKNNLNNTSIVMKLIVGSVSFLFAGDIEEEAEENLINKYCQTPKDLSSDIFYCQPSDNKLNLSVNVFKASHHGSDTSNTRKFLQAINPEFVIIQSETDNQFGHPSIKVLDLLEKMAIHYYRTDQDGRITFFSDGYLFGVEK